ncbi:MAG: DUF1194 domain-containing protein [Proteobacteria bacterium]|nr:DUF1194 domain-containing protein [Pseudomonadota bacterium]
MTVLIMAAPGQAEKIPVDLELVLAVDVSGSVDEEEGDLQRKGYVNAITSPEVIKAIQSGILRRIAVTYVEWAGEGTQSTILDWTIIKDRASAQDFARRLSEAPITSGPWTSISDLVHFALPLFNANDYRGTRRAIDISGDGPNNSGDLVLNARAKALRAGVTINGLPIVNDRLQPSGRPQIRDLDKYYAACVIGGPGAFFVVANDFQDFGRAVRRKLVFEIAGTMPPDNHANRRSTLVSNHVLFEPGCDIGERRLQRRRQFRDDQF